MAADNPTCSVCSVKFELHFRYQLEQRAEGDGGSRDIFYCSQRCLEASHHERTDGLVACDACATRFRVELAAQVLFTGGRRHYACGQTCRTRILEGVRQVRVGQLMDPGYPLAEESNLAAEAQTPEAPPLASPAPPPVAPIAARQAAANAAPERQTPRRQRVLAVFNHKGGTGKTTTAVHVAAGLAAAGQKVLLIDTDGQGNIGTSLGLKFERSLYHVIVMGLDYKQVVIEARKNLDVVPANETIAAAELYLAGQRSRDRLLASRFAGIRQAYDYVVVDCSPSLSLMNQNALVMADAVLCPVACDYLSLVGVQQVVRTIKQINRLLSHPLTFWGVLPTFFDTRARICHEALDTLRGHFRDVCLEPIRMASRVKEAPSQGKTLFEYAPGSSATLDYQRVVDRLLGKQEEAKESLSLEGVA